jgi:preprotein translocase subunit SecB
VKKDKIYQKGQLTKEHIMSDETQNTETDVAQSEENIAVDSLPMTVHAQYIRDFSFENPNSPESLRAGQKSPEMDVNIGMDARKLDDPEIKDLYEVVVNIRAQAMRGEMGVFLVELQYGVTVSLNNVPENQHHPLLLIEVPRLAFPYCRQIISDVTVQGGFPPLLLNPVDFHALYMQRFASEIEESQKAAQAESQKTEQS